MQSDERTGWKHRSYFLSFHINNFFMFRHCCSVGYDGNQRYSIGRIAAWVPKYRADSWFYLNLRLPLVSPRSIHTSPNCLPKFGPGRYVPELVSDLVSPPRNRQYSMQLRRPARFLDCHRHAIAWFCLKHKLLVGTVTERQVQIEPICSRRLVGFQIRASKVEIAYCQQEYDHELVHSQRLAQTRTRSSLERTPGVPRMVFSCKPIWVELERIWTKH